MLTDDATEILMLPAQKAKEGDRRTLTDAALQFPAVMKACWEYPTATPAKRGTRLQFDD
jgi:hypothetical protein